MGGNLALVMQGCKYIRISLVFIGYKQLKKAVSKNTFIHNSYFMTYSVLHIYNSI